MSDDVKQTRATTPLSGVPDLVGEEKAPVLVQLAGPGAVRRFVLDREFTRIGRDRASNEIVLEDPWVSRQHSRIVLPERGGARLEDLESRHGSQVNSRRVRDTDLADGDLIQIGQATFKYLDRLSAEAPFYQEVFRLAFRDPVAGTYSRRYFDEALAREVLRSDRRGTAIAVLLIDVDRFKTVNDALGHKAGDEVLAQTAGILQAVLRGESITARFGGDEFAILLPASDLDEATQVAERLREAVEAEGMGAKDQPVTISIGVAATGIGAASSPELLLAAADAALYRAKKKGSNCVEPALAEDAPDTEA